MIKYLIAHKKMIVDMETAPLDFTDIARAYRETEKGNKIGKNRYHFSIIREAWILNK